MSHLVISAQTCSSLVISTHNCSILLNPAQSCPILPNPAQSCSSGWSVSNVYYSIAVMSSRRPACTPDRTKWERLPVDPGADPQCSSYIHWAGLVYCAALFTPLIAVNPSVQGANTGTDPRAFKGHGPPCLHYVRRHSAQWLPLINHLRA